MNVWRLMSHHEIPQKQRYAEWIRREGTLAVGWGDTGDLTERGIRSEAELQHLLRKTRYTNIANATRSLWRLYKEMQRGDLVIIVGESRDATMYVTGDYYYRQGDPTHYYEHRRKAEAVPIDPNRLWNLAGGAASHEGSIYSALIRCAKPLSVAELRTIVG